MNEYERAHQVFLELKSAESAEPQTALHILNGLAGFVRGQSSEQQQSLEADEARSSAFLAICEVGKALHRGHPASPLWAVAIEATKKWMNHSHRT